MEEDGHFIVYSWFLIVERKPRDLANMEGEGERP
jgi:hypothetical protein